MIFAEFQKNGEGFSSFRVSGHAGYAPSGKDIVCAATSSAVQLTLNLLADSAADGEYSILEDTISYRCKSITKETNLLLNGLCEHLTALSEDYPKHIRVKIGR